MEWDVMNLSEGHIRLSLLALGRGETAVEIVPSGTSEMLVVLQGSIELTRPDGRVQLLEAGAPAVLSPGTYCARAHDDALAARGLVEHAAAPPTRPIKASRRRPDWRTWLAGVTLGGAALLWLNQRGRSGKPR